MYTTENEDQGQSKSQSFHVIISLCLYKEAFNALPNIKTHLTMLDISSLTE